MLDRVVVAGGRGGAGALGGGGGGIETWLGALSQNHGQTLTMEFW